MAVRIEPFAEWAIAAVVVLAVGSAASIFVREARTVDPATPVIARAPLADIPPPAGVPSGAVALPLFLFDDGTQIGIGDSLASVIAGLDARAHAGVQALEPGPHGMRLTRSYTHGSSRLVLVFEPSAADPEPRLAAIYLR